MVQYRVLDEYESGWAAVRGGNEYFVRTPSGDEIDFGSSNLRSNQRKSRLFAALCVRLGRLPLLDDPEVVPVDVAAAGKSAIAAYLWAVHSDHYTPEYERRPTLIAERFGVDPDTVTKYCRRMLRSVEEQKTGGVDAK